MKNAFGALLDKSRHYCHPQIHETLVDLLRIQKEIQAGTIAVADCTTAGSGPGPRTMTLVVKNLLIASEDQVAIDAVSARLIGFDPMTVPCIRPDTRQDLAKVASKRLKSSETWTKAMSKSTGTLLWEITPHPK